jgi:hypothetical protein
VPFYFNIEREGGQLNKVVLSTIEVEKLKEKYGGHFDPIKSDTDFKKVVVKLKGKRIDGNNSREFFNTVKRLLEYIQRTENEKHALLLTQVLHEIRIHSKFSLTDNATNVHQLCDLILIQFKHSLKDRVYYNVLKLLNYCEGSLGKFNIDSVLRHRIDNLEGNIYECFKLKLSIELLHTYLVLNKNDELHKLFYDICVDWYKFEKQVNEKTFEKLLWYSFILDRDKEIQEHIKQYDSLIKSNRWGIQLYSYVGKTFSETGHIDKEKLLLLVNRFKKINGYSNIEKESIIEQILKKVKEKQVITEVERLLSYNLPSGDKLSDINQRILINLAVYENKRMLKIKKIIQVEAFSHPKREDIYVNRYLLKKLIEENASGYICVKEDRKDNLKEKIEVENEWLMGLNEKSELRKRGYQITGTTREQRWKVLQRIVPDIGLKKVAYTIAGNVRLRKGQKDGNKKFSYSISEWEYDLEKLKKKYYKKEFYWPKT